MPVDPSNAAQLQLNLVRSHASGTGPPLDPRVVRAAGALRANSLSAGHSGVAPATLDLIVELFNRDVTPSFRVRVRSALAAIWHRSRICRWC